MSRMPETAVELRDALRTGAVSAREAAEHFLARIEERRDLGAFIAVTAERALAEADAADTRLTAAARRRRIDPATLPALHGMPIAHKDLVEVAGVPTTYGTAALPTRIAQRDGPVPAALRAAGAISLGKTQVPEVGLQAYSENLIAPPARNPLDPALTPGGSSGGSAAAVAAGLLPVAPGSDAGGSIRIPSLACGLVGLKPGFGAVPADLALGEKDDFGAQRLAVSGPIARTPEDAALLYDAMTRGANGIESLRSGGSGPALRAVRDADALAGQRVGMSTGSPFESVYRIALSPEALEAYELAAGRLDARGHILEEADFDYDPRYTEVFTSSWMSSLSLMELAPGADALLTPYTRVFRERALAKPKPQHLANGAELQRIGAALRGGWARYDVVLTPGLATPPPRVGSFAALEPDADYRAQCEWTPYTSMANVAGLPAVAVPMLRLPSGLSMGVQLIGREGSEPRLLQLAAQLMRP